MSEVHDAAVRVQDASWRLARSYVLAEQAQQTINDAEHELRAANYWLAEAKRAEIFRA